MNRNFAARADASVEANTGAGGRFEACDRSGRRQVAVAGILGIDPRFDCPAACRDVALHEVEARTRSDRELQTHEVESVYEFGDRMLDLQPRVHL